MPETTPLIKAALNLRVGVGFDVYGQITVIAVIVYLLRRMGIEYYGAAEPPVRCGESHLSGLTEPLRSL